jgi:hypothetical protein
MNRTESETKLAKLKLEGNKNIADNNRSNLLYNPERLWTENLKIGNWAWGKPGIPTPTGKKPYFRKPTPHLAGIIDWTHEGNQWLRSPEYREMYVQTYRNAWSTELAQATRNQLVPGYWHETITKGRVLTQEIKSDGVYNPDGPNLYRYNFI